MALMAKLCWLTTCTTKRPNMIIYYARARDIFSPNALGKVF